MACFGLYSRPSTAAQAAARSRVEDGCELEVVVARLNETEAFALVDGADRDSFYEYNVRAEPGWRLTKQRRSG